MTNERVNSVLDDLDQAFREQLALTRAQKLEAFIAQGDNARYLRTPRLTVAQHFDIEPAFVIFDPLLGSLGIVELLMAEAPTASTEPKQKEIFQSVQSAVDRATYLKHLLVRDRRRQERRPLSVELVLVTGNATEGEQHGLSLIGTALQRLLRDCDSLFHVGISVLCHGGPSRRFEGRLRRAFPWLLTATRRWLKSPRARANANVESAPAMPLRQLVLSNYRLPGERKLFLSDARVHLIHGPNGSGKSSIVEALELASTGSIERFQRAGELHYERTLQHDADTPVTLQIGRKAGAHAEMKPEGVCVVRDAGISNAIDATVDASSFRLDQPLMDRLVGSGPHDRAKAYLVAFFPDAFPRLNEYEQATLAFQTAMAKVDRLIERLTLTRQTLVELEGWSGGIGVHSSESFPVVLNRWLEKTAFVDLLQHIRTVQATLVNAQTLGWSSNDPASFAVSQSSGHTSDAELLRLEAEAKRAVDELQSKLDAYGAATGSPAPNHPPATSLSAHTIEALNEVSPFLFAASEVASYGRFGHKLAAVVQAGDAPTYGSIVIGGSQWTQPILKDIDSLLTACTGLRGDAPTAWTGKSPCAEYDEAYRTRMAQLQAGRELTERFIEKLLPDAGATGEFDGSLIAALNELLALITPARWAYVDILVPTDMSSGKVGVSLRVVRDGTGTALTDHRAELHLNTAELNLFTVALFLLCAGRVPKPLNLLVFDDPLQNMDELTTTALARGVTKLVRLWASLGRSEELLFLFHGQGDLERFRTEIAAATYRLPWLSPGRQANTVEIKGEAANFDVLSVQSLDGMSLQLSDDEPTPAALLHSV